MKKVEVIHYPKILREAKLVSIDKYGDFIFTTDCGMWCIDPSRLSGIGKRDINLVGTLTRYTENGKDKYKWVEDIIEQLEQQLKKGKKDELAKGLNVRKPLIRRLFK